MYHDNKQVAQRLHYQREQELKKRLKECAQKHGTQLADGVINAMLATYKATIQKEKDVFKRNGRNFPFTYKMNII
jgi:hypothetical protein